MTWLEERGWQVLAGPERFESSDRFVGSVGGYEQMVVVVRREHVARYVGRHECCGECSGEPDRFKCGVDVEGQPGRHKVMRPSFGSASPDCRHERVGLVPRITASTPSPRGGAVPVSTVMKV